MNLLKRILISTEIAYHLKNKTKIFYEFIKERSSEFWNSEKRINLDNLIYNCKTEGRSPKDFRNYQNLIKLFKDLRDGILSPREVLKNQNNFKSDLGKIRKRNTNLKLEDQIIVIENVENFFDLREKIIDFFRDYSFLLSQVKYKAKY